MLARRPLTLPIGKVLFVVIGVFGAAIIVFALSTHLILSLAALAVMGAADVVSVVIRFALVQLRTPPEMRGRVSAVNGMFTGTSNYLGDFRAGAVAAAIGAAACGADRRDWRVRGRWRFGCSFSRSFGVSVPTTNCPRRRCLSGDKVLSGEENKPS